MFLFFGEDLCAATVQFGFDSVAPRRTRGAGALPFVCYHSSLAPTHRFRWREAYFSAYSQKKIAYPISR